ncbi:MAG: tRNA pseudouridine(13) synthase TruD [Zestosphaera sp.]
MSLAFSEHWLDKAVGILLYSRPELRLGENVRFFKSGDFFKVYEIDAEGVQAVPPNPPSSDGEPFTCRGGEVLRYVLCKEGFSTPEAVRHISALMEAEVAYAGIKDSEGLTCQFITVKCRPGARREAYYELLEGRIKLFLHGRADVMLGRGDLGGNRFEVTLLGVNAGDIAKLEQLRDEGSDMSFLNYYGHQRFGTRRPVTHLVGRALLGGDVGEAVELILGKPYQGESPRVVEARRAYERGDFKESLKLFPRSFRVERLLLGELLKGRRAEEALKRVDEWLLRMYVEAYQSYLFNTSLSKLATDFGGVDELASACDTLPIPRPGLRVLDRCSQEFVAAVERELEMIDDTSAYTKYLNKGNREATFTPQNLTMAVNEDVVTLSFTLKPSTYGTILIRELITTHRLLH